MQVGTGGSGLALGGARHHLLAEALDDVADLQVVEIGQADAALEARGYFTDVVAEAAQRLDAIGGDRFAVARPEDPGATADDPTVVHVAAGDDRRLADAEDLADLGVA